MKKAFCISFFLLTLIGAAFLFRFLFVERPSSGLLINKGEEAFFILLAAVAIGGWALLIIKCLLVLLVGVPLCTVFLVRLGLVPSSVWYNKWYAYALKGGIFIGFLLLGALYGLISHVVNILEWETELDAYNFLPWMLSVFALIGVMASGFVLHLAKLYFDF